VVSTQERQTTAFNGFSEAQNPCDRKLHLS